MHFANAGVATAQQIQRLATLRVRLDGLLQTVYGKRIALTFLQQRFNAMVHPSELPVNVRLQLAAQLFVGSQRFVGLFGGAMLVLRFVQMGDVETNCGQKLYRSVRMRLRLSKLRR